LCKISRIQLLFFHLLAVLILLHAKDKQRVDKIEIRLGEEYG